MEEECPSQFKDSEKVYPADEVVIAFGFRANPADWFKDFKIKTDQAGLVSCSRKTGIKISNL